VDPVTRATWQAATVRARGGGEQQPLVIRGESSNGHKGGSGHTFPFFDVIVKLAAKAWENGMRKRRMIETREIFITIPTSGIRSHASAADQMC
jgi:hypothetical protein